MGSKSSKANEGIEKTIINEADSSSNEGPHLLQLGDTSCVLSIITFLLFLFLSYYLIRKKCRKNQLKNQQQQQQQPQLQDTGFIRRMQQSFKRYHHDPNPRPAPATTPNIDPSWQESSI